MLDDIHVTKINSIILFRSNPEKLNNDYSGIVTENELIFHAKGKSLVRYDDVTEVLSSGMVRILPKSVGGRKRDYTVDTLECGIQYDIMFETAEPISDRMLTFSFSDSNKVQSMFEQFHKLWLGQHSGYHSQCMALLYGIIAILQQSSNDNSSEKKYKRLRPAVNYLDDNIFNNDLDCDRLPPMCGICQPYFNKLFAEKYGASPIKYINERRIRYACDLLLSEKLSIAEIAAVVGYENQFYFSRVFSRIMGMPPSVYQKENCKKLKT